MQRAEGNPHSDASRDALIPTALHAGTIAPGSSAGALTISGDLTLAPASVLQLELGGVTLLTLHDRLTEAGTVPLALAGRWM